MTSSQIVLNEQAMVTSRQAAVWKYRYGRDHFVPKTFNDMLNHNIVLANYNDFIIIMGELSGLFIMGQSRVILQDGTFDIVENTGQLYIFHAMIGKQYSSCLFVKMMSRSKKSYDLMFRMIEKLAKDRHFTIFDREVIVKADFEQSVISTLHEQYPKVYFSGCLFHFSQCITRKVGDVKLKYLFNGNTSFRRFIRRVTYMALLPIKFVNKKH